MQRDCKKDKNVSSNISRIYLTNPLTKSTTYSHSSIQYFRQRFVVDKLQLFLILHSPNHE